jgi:hypothetical protein
VKKSQGILGVKPEWLVYIVPVILIMVFLNPKWQFDYLPPASSDSPPPILSREPSLSLSPLCKASTVIIVYTRLHTTCASHYAKQSNSVKLGCAKDTRKIAKEHGEGRNDVITGIMRSIHYMGYLYQPFRFNNVVSVPNSKNRCPSIARVSYQYHRGTHRAFNGVPLGHGACDSSSKISLQARISPFRSRTINPPHRSMLSTAQHPSLCTRRAIICSASITRPVILV